MKFMSFTKADWEHYLSGLGEWSPLGEVVLDSWARCSAQGVERTPSVRRVSDEELRRRLDRSVELVRIARAHLDWISLSLTRVAHVVYLVDRDGIVIHSVGTSPKVLEEACLLPGHDWSERAMGTNGAGTAVASGKPVAIVGDDHYSVSWRGYT